MTIQPQPSAKAPSRVILRRLVARQTLPLGLIGLCVWLLRDRIGALDFSGIYLAVRAIEPSQWLVAVLATILSFWAVGRYDAVIHRLLDTGVSRNAARLSGITGIATAQTTGFGLLIGTLARWRMLPDLSLWQSARITVAVTASFMAGLAVVTAVMVLHLGAARPVPGLAAYVVLIGALGFVALCIWRPGPLQRLSLPSLRAQAVLVALVVLDTVAASVALFALFPGMDLPSAGYLYTVFLLALGAGLIGATPGGIGPFEVVFLAFLPSVPEASLLAAITGFRLIYYAVPGAIAAVLLILGGTSGRRAHQPATLEAYPPEDARDVSLERLLFNATRAEAQLVRQRECDLLYDGAVPVALAAASGQSLIVMGDPLAGTGRNGSVLRLAERLAASKYLTPCFYKCSARKAAVARRAGWRVFRLSTEAWINPARFDLDVPERRQLRRLLRKAQASGLQVQEADDRLPIDAMRTLADDWARQRGGARGFSMGRFDEAAINRQRVFLCHDDRQNLVGFLTLHVARDEWTVDLMCQNQHSPSGTMQMLIVSAIHSARHKGCARVSLAATPRLMAEMPGVPPRVASWLDQRSGAPGLTRFKSAFAPQWQPLYFAAPSTPGLAMAALDVADRIVRPRKSNSRSAFDPSSAEMAQNLRFRS